mmetsp:Transcript_24880/g.80495  ORF Transcript_24880/g.80495 Transcript_24880/m.80495 type:complete len:259 (+) Transcript_24880:14-790(+)
MMTVETTLTYWLLGSLEAGGGTRPGDEDPCGAWWKVDSSQSPQCVCHSNSGMFRFDVVVVVAGGRRGGEQVGEAGGGMMMVVLVMMGGGMIGAKGAVGDDGGDGQVAGGEGGGGGSDDHGGGGGSRDGGAAAAVVDGVEGPRGGLLGWGFVEVEADGGAGADPGVVAAKGVAAGVGAEVEELSRFVPGSREDVPGAVAFLEGRDGVDGVGVALQRREAGPGVDVPDFGRAVVRPGGEAPVVDDGEAVNGGVVAPEATE